MRKLWAWLLAALPTASCSPGQLPENHELTIDPPAELPLSPLDPVLIEQVLVNLIKECGQAHAAQHRDPACCVLCVRLRGTAQNLEHVPHSDAAVASLTSLLRVSGEYFNELAWSGGLAKPYQEPFGKLILPQPARHHWFVLGLENPGRRIWLRCRGGSGA